MLFVCYAKCGTCKKAEKYLLDKGFTLEKRDIQRSKAVFGRIKSLVQGQRLAFKAFL